MTAGLTHYDPEKVLRETFGYESFRPHQREIIDAALAGRDVLAVMPTSAGKSLCYQIPALVTGRLVMVISPLISLMADQVGALNQLGVDAACLNSTLGPFERDLVLDQVRSGALSLLYLAPERLDDPRLLAALEDGGIGLLAVDEAHCISQWGNDFRPSYQHIRTFVEGLARRPPICALTASATAAVRRDIVSSLGLSDPLRVVASFDRPNLSFAVRRPRDNRDKMRQLKAFVREQGDASGIVYCLSRRAVEEVCQALCVAGIPATRYHAGLGAAERARNQDDFIYDRRQVIVATNAFGMGIDKSNVSYVVHYNLPLSMEAYYQEAGRAGRDGTKATCLLFYSPADVHTAEFLISQLTRDDLTQGEARDLVAHDERRLRDMIRYATSSGCLRHQLLAYFGEESPDSCGNCSNCLATWEEVDRTTEALKVVSCVARLSQRQTSLGAGMICQILRGSRDQRVLQRGLDSLSTYGIMSDTSAQDIHALLDELVARGILARSEGAYPVICLTDRSMPFLRAASQQDERFVMRVAHEPARRKDDQRPKASSGRSATRRAVAGELDETGRDLFEQLRQLRADLAREQAIPPYLIFTNATLEDMCRRRPRTIEELLEVSGVGQKKAERYGQIFLSQIAKGE